MHPFFLYKSADVKIVGTSELLEDGAVMIENVWL